MSPSHNFRFDDRWDPPAPVVTVGVAKDRGDQLVQVSALLDSGADISVIPATLVDRLRLDAIKNAKFGSFQGGTEVSASASVYQVYLEMPDGIGRGRIELLEHEFMAGQEHLILGRDLLNNWRITLDGPNLQFDISA